MIGFETALRAKLPFIAVHTDDPVNVKAVLQSIAQKTVMPLPSATNATVGDAYVYWTEDLKAVTTEMYRKLCASTASCVVVNPPSQSMLVFEAGVLLPPEKFYVEYLQPFALPQQIQAIVGVLKGLSLKTAQEVVQLTMARVGSVLPNEVRKTRQMLGGEHPGLYTLDTEYDFYEWPKPLKEWLALNDKFFLDPKVPDKIVPRGLLLAGEPGVGKSMASMVLAKHWDVPLFRLDVSTNLTRWLGESEGRIARNLSIIEANAPCVWLLDEAEKLFDSSGDEKTTQRILSQILWWLQYHKARVMTIMTTNDKGKLPKELYRAGRVDRVIEIEKLKLSDSKLFAAKVYETVLGKPITMKRRKTLHDLIEKVNKPSLAHAEVRVLVYDSIKVFDWLNGDSNAD